MLTVEFHLKVDECNVWVGKREAQLSGDIDTTSVADPDPFDTDPDPAFHFDPDRILISN
jgi:hypothetical protein